MSRRAGGQIEPGRAGAWTRARPVTRRVLAGVLAALALAAQARPAAPPAAPAAASAAAASVGWARMANTVFEHLGQHDGLPHAIATGVAEDAQGYLWAGTQDGVARWDGYRFKVYPARPDDPHGLPVSYVRTIASDARGRIWVGMDGGGVARFDAAENWFTRFGGSTVTELSPDAEGGMWAASTTGLMHVRASGQVEDAWAHGGAVDPLPESAVTAVLQDRAGAVWIGTASGLVERFPDGRPGRRIALPGGAAVPVDALYQDRHGQVWIGSNLHGVFVLDPATGRVARLQPAGAPDAALATDSATSFEENGDDEMWIGTQTRGLVIADTSSLLARRVVRDRSVPSNLQANWIWGLHRDRGGEMWVASTAGLSRTRPQQDAILSLFSSDSSSWSDPYVFSVDADPRGVVTLGQKSGIEVIDPIEPRMEALPGDGDDAARAPAISNVAALVHTADGTRYMASRDGLFSLAPGSRRIQAVAMPERGAIKYVTALLLDGSTLWVGGKGDGIWQMDLAVPTHPMRQPVPASALSDPEVTAIARGPDGAMWIATNNGLNLVRANRLVQRIMPVAGDPASLASAVINTLLTDRQGRLWVGNNAGVQILEKIDAGGRAVFHHIGKAEGLTSENIDTLLMDSTGRIWVSTDDGIAVVDPSTYALRVLHPADGAAISTYWVNSGAAGPTGELFFGGLGGLTVVRPERLAQRAYSAPLVVTDVELGGRPAALADANGRRRLTVPPETGGFAVEFSLLDFTAPERNRYAYWLEGYDRDWRVVDTTHRSAGYTNLPPGHYVLHLKAAAGDGGWTPHPVEVDVVIQPAWYQTWWFDLLKVAGALLAVAAVVAVRLRYVQRRSQDLARLVERRTHELTQLQHQLEELAYSDALTGLPNRRMFGDHCRRMIAGAQRQGGGFALLLIDLDHFKQVNDTLGHDAGDALLVETARRLRAVARQVDVVARLGGDEFAILLADAGTVGAAGIVCQRICDAFGAPITHEGREMRTSPSIGVALFPADGQTQDALYKSADLALYEAKHQGRHTWRFARHAGEAAAALAGVDADASAGTVGPLA